MRTITRIREVDPAAWDRLAGDNPLLSHGWLRVMEDEWQEPVERRYILAEEHGCLVAAAACYVDVAGGGAESVDDLLFGRLRNRSVGRVLTVQPALVCGYPWNLSSGCITAPGLGEVRHGALIESLVKAVTAEARRSGCTAVFLSVAETEAPLMKRLRSQGFRYARHEPVYVLEVEWPDFEHYRQALPSRNIRQNIRYELNRNRREGVVISEVEDPSACDQRLHEVVDQHFRRYGWPEFPYGPGWFRAVKSSLGGDAVLTVAHRNDRLIGVAVSLRKQGTRQMLFVCIDHENAGNDFTHFNLAYYWGVADCIRAGDVRYCIGPGQHDVRRRRGYALRSSYIFCRPPSRLRRALLGLWMRVLDAWLQRRARGVRAQSCRFDGSRRRTSSTSQSLRRA